MNEDKKKSIFVLEEMVLKEKRDESGTRVLGFLERVSSTIKAFGFLSSCVILFWR